jgi:hypothetical protein
MNNYDTNTHDANNYAFVALSQRVLTAAAR